jgi:hypothetical protein
MDAVTTRLSDGEREPQPRDSVGARAIAALDISLPPSTQIMVTSRRRGLGDSACVGGFQRWWSGAGRLESTL